jgi:hypothetical protein
MDSGSTQFAARLCYCRMEVLISKSNGGLRLPFRKKFRLHSKEKRSLESCRFRDEMDSDAQVNKIEAPRE